MKTIASWGDLEPYGIIPLTGESCGLGYRILFDVTEKGRQVIAKCFGIPGVSLPEPWNRGSADNFRVGSIMLAPEMLMPLSIFALLETGCKEVYRMGEVAVGFEDSDASDAPETMRRIYRVEYARRFAYHGTAGDRNVHMMSGRVV